jgi:hypothetical protein
MVAQTPKSKPDAGRKFSAMVGKLGVTVPATWPVGASLLTQAYDACRRCDADEICTDWLKEAPDSIQLPPASCPNAAESIRAKKRK